MNTNPALTYIEDVNKAFDTLQEYITSLEEQLASIPTGELFDPAIHKYIPNRPISLATRNDILSRYNGLYKAKLITTLPEFFSHIREEVDPTVSDTEIQAVIYNKHDIRLYK